jgi:hypothetical protein
MAAARIDCAVDVFGLVIEGQAIAVDMRMTPDTG